MARATVVSPGLTPDWLKKRKGVMSAIETQLIERLASGTKGLDLEHLQALVEHRNPFTREHPEYVIPLRDIQVDYDLSWIEVIDAAGDGSVSSSREEKRWLLEYEKGRPRHGRTGAKIINVNLAMYPARPMFPIDELRKIGRQAELGRSVNARELFALWRVSSSAFYTMGFPEIRAYSLEAKQLGQNTVVPVAHVRGNHSYPAMEAVHFEALRICGQDDLLPCRYCCVAYTHAE